MRALSSAPDPFRVPELPLSPNNYGWGNPNGRTLVSSVITDRPNTKVIITDGQSLMASSATGSPHTPLAGVHNLNIYDGGIYVGADPVLGASFHAGGIPAAPTSPNLHIGDRLIATGKATRRHPCTACRIFDLGRCRAELSEQRVCTLTFSNSALPLPRLRT